MTVTEQQSKQASIANLNTSPGLRRFSLTLDEVAELAATANTIPMYYECVADLETVTSAYLKLRGDRSSFLLESVEGGQTMARYSFVGADPYLEIRLEDGIAQVDERGRKSEVAYADPLAMLQEILAPYKTIRLPGLPRFTGGAVGYLSYESVRYFERLPVAVNDPNEFPDGRYALYDTLVIFDRLEQRMKVVSHVHTEGSASLEAAYNQAIERIKATVRKLNAPQPELPVGDGLLVQTPARQRGCSNMDREYYDAMIERAQTHIQAGDIFQIVPSQRIELETGAHSFSVYRALRTVNPSPYLYYLDFGDEQIIGASPEALIRLEDGELTTHPIAGTRRRGQDATEDESLEAELQADEKECAEHIMLVDLARNDIGRVAEAGTVNVPVLLTTEKFSHVIHLVSHVTGRLQAGLTGFDALRACFPAGTVSGAPKIRAMEIIAELERDRRGIYSGVVGYVDYSGNLDQALALRTLVMRGQKIIMQAGGGIVADSVAENEFQETLNKMAAGMQAVELAEELEQNQRQNVSGLEASA